MAAWDRWKEGLGWREGLVGVREAIGWVEGLSGRICLVGGGTGWVEGLGGREGVRNWWEEGLRGRREGWLRGGTVRQEGVVGREN